MEVNSTGQHTGRDIPSRSEPVEEQRTDEELALIYAAMMEELGIGRKDTLPLEDKGPKVHIKPIKKLIDDDPNDPTAKWRNIQFDDVDPAEAELDSMYDGQLYRLRRGTSGNAHQHGFSSRVGQSPGRGRGGGASRGSHSSTNGRGGSSRGGHSSGLKGPRTDPSSATPRHSAPTPKTFFNDARRGINNHARIDAAIARLRALPTPETIAAKKEKEEAEQKRQAAAITSSSRRPQAPAAVPRFALASQDAFLAYAGFNKPAPPKPAPPNTARREPSLPSSPNVTSREDHESPLGLAKVRLPQASRSADKPNLQAQPQIKRNVGAEENNSILPILTSKEDQPPTLQNREVGLAGSRWASTSKPVVCAARTPSITATPPSPPPELPAKTLATSSRSVSRENTVKVTNGRGGVTRCMARLVQNNPKEDKYFTLEIEIEGKIILNAEVLDDDTWKCEGTVVTYGAKVLEDESAPMPSTTWSMKFQMPYQAMSFYNVVLCNLTTRNNRPQGNKDAQPAANPAIAAPNQSEPPIEKSNLDTSSSALVSSHLNYGPIQQTNIPESSSLNNPVHPPTVNTNVQLSQQAASAVNGDSHGNTASTAESGQTSILDSDPIPQEQAVMPSMSPLRIPSQEWSFQPISDLHSAGLLDHYQPGATHRISSESLTDMTEVAGFEPLLSFGNDEPERVPDFVKAFLDMDDTELVQTTFDLLEKKPEGSILDQLSNIVAKDNIPPASQLSGSEILSSSKYQEAAENLVGGRFCYSETFAMLPDMISIHYTTEKSRKILEKAVAQRERQNAVETSLVSQSSQAIKQLEDRQSDSQPQVDIVNGYGLEQPTTTNTTDISKGVPSRLAYSAEDLLSLRSNAAKFRSDLVSNEVAHHVVRYSAGKPTNPAIIIGKTKNGLPIVAGRNNVARQSPRGNTGGPEFKPATTVGAWQAYCVAKPGAEPTTPIETPHNKPTFHERPKSQFNADSTQAPTVQKVPTSNSSGTSAPVNIEPVMSPGKLPHASHTQETDMALWGALLTSVRDKEQEPSRIRALSNNSKPPAPQVSPKGTRHIPTNSDCDRLVKSFEGLHLSTDLKDQPSIPKPQLTAGSEAIRGDSQPPTKKQPPSAFPLALNEKIQKTLRLPLNMSPRPKSSTATAQPLSPTEIQVFTNSIQFNTSGIIQFNPASIAAKPVSAPEVTPENLKTGQVSSGAQSTTLLPPIQPSLPEPPVKVESPEIKLSSIRPPFPGMAQPAHPTPEVESKNVNKNRSEPTQAHVPENAQPVAQKVKVEELQTSETVSATSQIPEKALPLLENVTNKDLKGVPGLAASKWASGAINQEFIPRAPSLGGRKPTISPMPAFNPIIPLYGPYNHVYASELTVGTPPVLQTVLISDPLRPGYLMEVTGIPGPASQVPSPLPSMMSPLTKQENIPYALQTSPVSYFAPRQDMYHGHRSNNSSGSDLNFTASGTSFKSRGRGDSAGTPQPRGALSPVRQGENVQAKLQSRLNNSLAGRSPNARG